MTLTEAFSNIEEMLSIPILLFDFKLFIIFFVSFSLTGVNWKLVSFVLFFRYDLKLGFPLVINLFVRCGPISMKKLLNCVAISFLSVILVSFTFKYVGNCFCILDLLITSAVFPCFFDVIPVLTKLQVIISSLCFSF